MPIEPTAQHSAAPKRLATPRRVILTAAALVSAAVLGTYGAVVADLRAQAHATTEQTARDLAVLLEAQTARTFDAADLVLRQAIELTHGGDWELVKARATFDRLRAVTDRFPYIESTWIGDGTGLALASSIAYPAPRASAADREYFRVLREKRDMFVDGRINSRVSGRDIVNTSRGIYGPDGALVGFVTASIDPLHIGAFYERVNPGFPVELELIRAADMSVLAGRPNPPPASQGVLRKPADFAQAAAGGAGQRYAAAADGAPMLESFRPVEDYGLIVNVRVPQSAIDAVWRGRALDYGAFAGLALLSTGLLAGFGMRRARAEERAQAALLESSQIYHAFVDTTEDGVVLIGIDGDRFVYERVNPTMLRLFGPMAANAIGRTPQEAAPPGMAATFEARYRQCAASGQVVAYEEVLPTPGGPHRFEVTLVPIRDAAGTVRKLYATLRDVTERRRIEETLRQAQKMEAVGQLTGGVAHDFNNMLTVVMGHLDRARRALDSSSPVARAVASAMMGAERAAALTQQLLAFARRQPLAPQAVNLNRVVADMTDMLRRTLGETVEIEVVGAGGLWDAYADRTQLENALLNLVINARDAMGGQGRVTVETANAHLDDAYAESHADVAAGQYVMLAVTDTGCGMPAEVAARCFEPFFTTKEPGQGTGLGLSMVYGFAKQSGGHAKVYSEVGQGTTVRLYLPRWRGPAPEPEAAAPRLGAADLAGGGATVMVVEDDPDVRATVVAMLEDLGFGIVAAANGAEALELLRGGAEVDLLFTDVVMPGGLSGRDLAHAVATLRPGLRVLFTSGYTANAIVHHGRLDDGVQLLSKPYTQDQLARKLRQVLDGSV